MKTEVNRTTVDILIVTIIDEELEAILGQFSVVEKKLIGTIFFYFSEILTDTNDHIEVAIMKLTNMGNVQASTNVTQAINILSPGYIITIGIAGGVKNKVSLGDILISDQIIYYEQGKITENGKQSRPIMLAVDNILLTLAQNYKNTSWQKNIIIERPLSNEEVHNEFPKIHYGPIASGENVISAETFVNDLKNISPKLIGLDMESYGAAFAANSHSSRPRFITFRGVSDYADSSKNDDWHSYACSSVAAYTAGFLKSGFVKSPASSNTIYPSNLPNNKFDVIAIRHMSFQEIPYNTIQMALNSDPDIGRIYDVPIIQSEYYQNGILINHDKAEQLQNDVNRRIQDIKLKSSNYKILFFGVAHIPLLFSLGYQLTNKQKLYFYEFDRYKGTWQKVDGEELGPTLNVEGLPDNHSDGYGDIVIQISISNKVNENETKLLIPNSLATISISPTTPKRDLISSEYQLYQYGKVFRNTLDQLHDLFPNRSRTHLFYAGPVSLAVYLGQLIIPSVDREMIIYNYSTLEEPNYAWFFNLSKEVSSIEHYQRVIK